MKVSEATRRELRERPHYLRALDEGVASLRSMARELKPAVEERVGEGVSEEAVVSALRRTEGSHSGESQVLEESRLTLRRGAGVMTIPAGISVTADMIKTAKSVERPELLRIVQGERKTTIVAHGDDLEVVEEALEREPLFRETGLAEIVVTSPEDIEEEPGIIAEMTARLGVRGINVYEMMSCNTDTIFVVAEGDAEEAVEALEF